MKKLLYTISIVLIASSTFAQDLTDVLRYSNYHINGTARSAAMGNAFGALGGDFTSLSINPAGAAVYRSGEFTFTPSVDKISVDGTYLGNKATDSKYNMSINNIGYVTTIPTGENSESGLVSLSFGLGFNRLGSFSMNSLAEGANANSSLLGYFTSNMNKNYSSIYGNEASTLDPYYEKLAWDTYLINHDDQKKEYYNSLTDNDYKQSQRKTIDRRGYINEYLLSFAANFNHKFFVGATLGIHDVYFNENSNLYEFDANNNIPDFSDFNFGTTLKTTGTGYNFKVGAIYKPTDNLRLGFAVHSPTFYKFNDLYDSSISTSTYNNGELVKPDKAGVYDYELETPLKAVISGAYVIGKSGLISVDYEIVDYSTAKLKNGSDGYDYYKENNGIQKAYKTVGNLHLGGEYRVNKSFSLRAGYENFPSVYQSSYLNTTNPNGKSKYSTISGGFGFKQGNIFFDAAIKRTMIEDYLKIYPDPNANEMIKNNTTQNNLIFTLGYKF